MLSLPSLFVTRQVMSHHPLGGISSGRSALRPRLELAPAGCLRGPPPLSWDRSDIAKPRAGTARVSRVSYEPMTSSDSREAAVMGANLSDAFLPASNYWSSVVSINQP